MTKHFGWVPDAAKDDYLERVKVVIERRPDLELIDSVFVTTVHDLVEKLENDNPSSGDPIDDIVVAGHAHRTGHWTISLFNSGSTQFEEIEETSQPGHSIEIPDWLIDFDPSVSTNTIRSFHIKGCSLGRAPKFILKLQEALGGHVAVTAPKHAHGVSNIGKGHFVEWMQYEFVIFSKTHFAGKAAMIDGFKAAQLELVDGTPVPDAQWAKWLEPVGKLKELAKLDKRTTQLAVELTKRKMKLSTPISKIKTARGELLFFADNPQTLPQFPPFKLDYTSHGAIPASEQQRLDDLKAALLADDMFAHPIFPVHERLEYASFDDMFDNLVWTFEEKGLILQCSGGRYEYELQVGIAVTSGNLDPTKGAVIVNHHPPTGTGVVTAIAENDTDFFFIAPVTQ